MAFANHSAYYTFDVTNNFNNISMDEDCSIPLRSDNQNVYLRIREEPQNSFRYRYRSEMGGTHGCLLGVNSNKERKTYPTVELVNYDKRAVIKCSLVHHNNENQHPHKVMNDDKDEEVCGEVPEHNSYMLCFKGLSIIQRAKKDIIKFEKNKHRHTFRSNKELEKHCEKIVKETNMNKVRLKFSAHHFKTGELICPPVFSKEINNIKSVETNDLKICRMSLTKGQCSGDDEVFLLVEKINKKNVAVKFYEMKNDVEVWKQIIRLLPTDVHHQYAIVIRTPPYRDQNITKDVKVHLELVGIGDDKRKSNRMEFTYTPRPAVKLQVNKRKASASLTSSGSVKNELELNIIEVDNNNKLSNTECYNLIINNNNNLPQSIHNNECYEDRLADALYEKASEVLDPCLNQARTSHADQFSSVDALDLLNANRAESDVVRQYLSSNWDGIYEYLNQMDDKEVQPSQEEFMEFSSFANLEKDSPCSKNMEQPTNTIKGYTSSYSKEHADEIKKLVKRLSESINNRDSSSVSSTLERLINIRLNNGDTFLFVTMHQNQSAFQLIVGLIHQMNLQHLLNLTNKLGQTVLHVAIMNKMNENAKYLIQKGCNPYIKDKKGMDALEYALKYDIDALKSPTDDKTTAGDEAEKKAHNNKTPENSDKTSLNVIKSSTGCRDFEVNNADKQSDEIKNYQDDIESIKSEPDEEFFSANEQD